MKKHHLEVTEVRGASGLRREMCLHADGVETVNIFHESPMLTPLADDTPLDGHILCQLLHMMRVGLPVEIHGAVSSGMMRNLEELQRIWVRWKPQLYRQVDIRCEKIVDARRVLKPSRAIAAFSGGADATFTALSHRATLPASVRYPLTDVLMVHGFDIDLNKPEFFSDLQNRVRPLLDHLGLGLRTIATNSKDWKRQSWDDSFMLELAACLHMFSNEFDYALAGSSEPYDSLILPWGSTPVADHLMSGDLMKLVHDGAGYSRTDKIHQIAAHPIASQTLKVCWAGEDQSGNCGVCEKCTRTILNFLASGHAVPKCFPNGLDLKNIHKMKLYNAAQQGELRSILRYARDHGVEGAWMHALEKRLEKPLSSYSPPLYRRIISSTLQAIGLKQMIKKTLKIKAHA